jgi:hypothetical protein
MSSSCLEWRATWRASMDYIADRGKKHPYPGAAFPTARPVSQKTAGISVDILSESLKNATEAWSEVRPFVQTHKVNYSILMGDDRVTKAYDI